MNTQQPFNRGCHLVSEHLDRKTAAAHLLRFATARRAFRDHAHSRVHRGDGFGDHRTTEFRLTAREIAEDLAREINGDSGEGSYHGVFVAGGEIPTEGQLVEAHRRLEEFQRRFVAAPDLQTSPAGSRRRSTLSSASASRD